jgi:hypothetical protein
MRHSCVARKLWRDYCASSVDTVIFVVDAADRSRFPEAKSELDVSPQFAQQSCLPRVIHVTGAAIVAGASARAIRRTWKQNRPACGCCVGIRV